MKIDASLDKFASWIGDFLRFELHKDEENFVFTSRSGDSLQLGRAELEDMLVQLKLKKNQDGTTIYDEHTCEVIVRHTSRFPILRREVSKKDSLNGITYTLSSPSSEYILFILYRLSKTISIQSLSSPNPNRTRRSKNGRPQNVLEILKKASPYFLTLRIESEQSQTGDSFMKYITAFLFELGYNLNAAFITPKNFEDLLRFARFRSQDRKTSLREILPPRRFYNPDLTYYYQLALASEDPSLQYLSYYHILEYFGENIFVADMIERVQHIITQAGFSYRRKDDIEQLIKAIEELPRTRPRSTDNAKRDERALRMTLERYVVISELLESLQNYANLDSLVTYYQDKAVPFVNKGSVVNLESNTLPEVFAHLTRRIYQTRNAIVHSKEAEQSRYIPFRDDIHLLQEIPLLRFCAEQIIMKSSTIIPN